MFFLKFTLDGDPLPLLKFSWMQILSTLRAYSRCSNPKSKIRSLLSYSTFLPQLILAARASYLNFM